MQKRHCAFLLKDTVERKMEHEAENKASDHLFYDYPGADGADLCVYDGARKLPEPVTEIGLWNQRCRRSVFGGIGSGV